MRPLVRALLAGALALGLGGCSDTAKALEDDSACPGQTCTEDTQARYDAIAGLDGVTRVESVARTYGLDSGEFRTARLSAAVGSRSEAHALLVEVLGELDAWPGHDTGPAEATVVSDPPVDVEYTARKTEDLTNPYFRPCSPAKCRAAIDDLEERISAEVDGVRAVHLVVEAGVLRITGTTDPDSYELAAAAVRRLVFDAALRMADRMSVEMTARGPLSLTLRLDGGLVCEQPPGTTVGCEQENSRPFDNS
jgi:hypothetical protein